MKPLNDSNFDIVEQASNPSLVMFHAPWAGPCNMARPTYETIASRYGNQIDFYEFDLDDNPAVPEKYGVRAVPLFMMLVDGVPVGLKAGAVPEEALEEMCEEVL